MLTVTKRRFQKQLLEKTAGERKARAAAVQLAEAASGGRNDLLPDLVLEARRIGDLRGFKRAVRKLTPEHTARVAASLKRFGCCRPPLIRGNGEIIDGATTVAALQSLGIDEVQCIVVDHLSEEEARALRLALNSLGERGEWDLDELKAELVELIELEVPVIDLGFTLPEIDILTSSRSDDKAADRLPTMDPEGAIVSREGDVWILEHHRITCGDATKPETYERLLRGALATAMFADFPYDIPIGGFAVKKGNAAHQHFSNGVGEMGEMFVDFLADAHTLLAQNSIRGATVFSCMDFRHVGVLIDAGGRSGLKLHNIVTWNKGSGMSGGLYRNASEFIVVFTNGDKPAINNVALGKHGRDRTTVWPYAGANRRGSSANRMLKWHATAKPVELVADAIIDVSNRGDLVLDPALGSGTTIIAAERTGRVGYGIEISGFYVDVAVRRWEELTGKVAIHEATGLTFEQLACEREAEARAAADAAADITTEE